VGFVFKLLYFICLTHIFLNHSFGTENIWSLLHAHKKGKEGGCRKWKRSFLVKPDAPLKAKSNFSGQTAVQSMSKEQSFCVFHFFVEQKTSFLVVKTLLSAV